MDEHLLLKYIHFKPERAKVATPGEYKWNGVKRLKVSLTPDVLCVLCAYIFLWLIPSTCCADWTMDFVKITCIPEASYLQVEYRPVDGNAVLMETELDKRKRTKRLSVWKKHGYYDPMEKIRYECRMPESTYIIIADQPPPQSRGECGVSQSITLSLLRNGKPVLDKIIIGNNCFAGPTVDSFEISDGHEGWASRNMTICISSKAAETTVCEFDRLGEKKAIEQDDLDKYVDKKRH